MFLLLVKILKSPGFYNDAPNLTNLDSNGDIKYTIDFRTIYASILENWLNANHSTILNKSFDTLSFI